MIPSSTQSLCSVCVPVVTVALGKQRQENPKFRVILDYKRSPRPAWYPKASRSNSPSSWGHGNRQKRMWKRNSASSQRSSRPVDSCEPSKDCLCLRERTKEAPQRPCPLCSYCSSFFPASRDLKPRGEVMVSVCHWIHVCMLWQPWVLLGLSSDAEPKHSYTSGKVTANPFTKGSPKQGDSSTLCWQPGVSLQFLPCFDYDIASPCLL